MAELNLAENFDAVVDIADKVYRDMDKRGASAAAAVAAIDLDETQPALQQVAAIRQKPQNSNRGGKRGGKGGSVRKPQRDPADKSTWGKPHRDFEGSQPPAGICMQHHIFGKNAHFCRLNDTCPWRNFKNPPSDQK